MRGMEHLELFMLGKVITEWSGNLDLCLRSWWDDILTTLETMALFEEKQRGENILWTPLHESMETALDLL